MSGASIRRAACAAACAGLLPAAAMAQTVGAPAGAVAPEGPQPAGQTDRVTGRRTYDAAWFAPFAPATALQMVQRVPGFTIERIDEGVRGFAQAAGNVVVNGQRPSAKSDDVETILGRIPASRVLRVEVGTGEQFGAEFAAKPQVLNVVTTQAGGMASTLEGAYRRSFTGEILPQGRVSTLLKRGRSTFNLALNVENDTSDEEGFDRVTTLPDGVETEFRVKHNHIRDPLATLSGSWAFDDGANRTAHLNGRIARGRFALTQDNRVTRRDGPPGGVTRDDALTQRLALDEFEIGGDVTRPLAQGGLKLIGLVTRRNRDGRDRSLLDLAAPTGFDQRYTERFEESLARMVWNRADLAGWNVEAGAEGVLNRFDSRNDLFALLAGGGRRRIDLPVDDATVKEVRGEAFVNVGRLLATGLRLDGGLTLEGSRLTVSGDVAAARTLSFLKPRMVLDWRPGPKWHAQFLIQRTVAQLRFGDFISTAELGTERVNGGNAELLPQRSWETLATLEHPIWGDGVVRLEAGYNRVEKVQDRIPTPEGFDAPGNLGDGETWILRSRVEAPLKPIGIRGARLTLYGSLVSTSVRDPYTGRDRPFSGNALFFGEATFRQDLGKLAWGFGLEQATRSISFRRDEEDQRWSDLYATAFAEWRPDVRTTLRFELDNALDAAAYADRRFFRPDRRTPAPSLREERVRNRHVLPVLSVRRTFG